MTTEQIAEAIDTVPLANWGRYSLRLAREGAEWGPRSQRPFRFDACDGTGAYSIGKELAWLVIKALRDEATGA